MTFWQQPSTNILPILLSPVQNRIDTEAPDYSQRWDTTWESKRYQW
ncbi:hypothetical protein [Porphyromonas sp. COT-108 OH1349]|nr:hypothetical protein [Porphyromonas sp. COT-108 OH1349]